MTHERIDHPRSPARAPADGRTPQRRRDPAAEQILRLQRRAGNAAVARALVARAEKPQPVVPAKPASAEGPYALKKADYTFSYKTLTKAGGELQVFAPDEAEPVGRASFAIEDRPLTARPRKDEPYTTEHMFDERDTGRYVTQMLESIRAATWTKVLA
jgi:hypothetical protein